eukprot:symbB.v1.2.007806.t1/scaffold485.1/size197678/9
MSFAEEETFDTQIACGRCLPLEKSYETVSDLETQVLAMRQNLAEISSKQPQVPFSGLRGVDTLFRQTAAFSVQNHTLRKSLALPQLTLTLMVLRATACLLALLLVTGLAAEEDACEAVPTNATALLQTLQISVLTALHEEPTDVDLLEEERENENNEVAS